MLVVVVTAALIAFAIAIGASIYIVLPKRDLYVKLAEAWRKSSKVGPDGELGGGALILGMVRPRGTVAAATSR